MAALMAVVAAVTAGVQLAYSSASYAAGVVLSPPTEKDPAALTPLQRQHIPRTAGTRRLPQGRMIDTFRKDPSNTTYHDPNPVVKAINPDAILPAGFEKAYLNRISDAFVVRCFGDNARLWEMDPNLKVASYITPRVLLPQSNITAEKCPLHELQRRSTTTAVRCDLPGYNQQSNALSY